MLQISSLLKTLYIYIHIHSQAVYYSTICPLQPDINILHVFVMLKLVTSVEYLLPLCTNLSSFSEHYSKRAKVALLEINLSTITYDYCVRAAMAPKLFNTVVR